MVEKRKSWLEPKNELIGKVEERLSSRKGVRDGRGRREFTEKRKTFRECYCSKEMEEPKEREDETNPDPKRRNEMEFFCVNCFFFFL